MFYDKIFDWLEYYINGRKLCEECFFVICFFIFLVYKLGFDDVVFFFESNYDVGKFIVLVIMYN